MLGRLVSAKFYEKDKVFFFEFLTEIIPEKEMVKGNIYATIVGSDTGTVINKGLKELILTSVTVNGIEIPYSKLSGNYIVLLEKHEDDENIPDHFIRIYAE